VSQVLQVMMYQTDNMLLVNIFSMKAW